MNITEYNRRVQEQAWSPLLGIPGPQRQAASEGEDNMNEWDMENNNDATLVFNRADLQQYICPLHGVITEIITFAIDNTNTRFCTRCARDKLTELIGVL